MNKVYIRDELAGHLPKRSVAVHHPNPVYGQPVYKELGYGQTACLMVEEACKRVLSLPVHSQSLKKILSTF